MPNESKYAVSKKLLVSQTAEHLRIEQDMVLDILDDLLSHMQTAFEKGQCVDLGADFGRFSVKLSEGYRNLDSPRTPRPSRYTVVFKSASALKKRLQKPTGDFGEKA
jgi:nucleoid DNA-binding protein